MAVGGYVGKILFVNLTDSSITTLDTLDYTDYIGGKGIALRLQWEFGNPEVEDGFDPKSPIIFMTGPLSGTPVPTNGRTLLAFKHAAQESGKCYWTHSGFGGAWGPELKFAGFDGVVVTGASETPVYLWIHDGEIEIKDASSIWGKDTYTTEDSIREELGNDPGIRIMKIGPAGENMLRGACILNDTCHAAGQNGGGVMGSKKLKAIAVRGHGGVPVANLDAILADKKKHLDIFLGSDTRAAQAKGRTAYPNYKGGGACFGCDSPCRSFMMPPTEPKGGSSCGWYIAYNWSRATFLGMCERQKTEYGDYYNEPKAPYSIDEWAGLYAKSMDLYGISGYDMLGMRTAGNWLMAICHDPIMEGKFLKLVVDEMGGEPGSIEFAQSAPRKVTYREGKFGKLLAEGVLRAAMEIRDNPVEYGLTAAQGQFVWEAYQRVYPTNYAVEHHFYRPSCAHPGYDIRDVMQSPVTEMLMGLGTRDTMSNHHSFHCIQDDIGHRSTRAYSKATWGSEEAGARYLDADGNPLLQNQLDSPEKDTYYTFDLKESTPVKPNFTVGAPEALRISRGTGMQTDSLCYCDWRFPCIAGGQGVTNTQTALAELGMDDKSPWLDTIYDPSTMTDMGFGARFYSAVTGIEKTEKELLEDGLRCVVLERAILVRDNNRTREDDYFNDIIHNRPDKNGITIPKDELKKGYDMYSELMGFDKVTGNPTRACLEKYGLKDVADELEAMGRLPG